MRLLLSDPQSWLKQDAVEALLLFCMGMIWTWSEQMNHLAAATLFLRRADAIRQAWVITGIKIFHLKEWKPKSIENLFLFFAWVVAPYLAIKVLFILYFLSDPESESIRSLESESKQPHHDSAPLVLSSDARLSSSFTIWEWTFMNNDYANFSLYFSPFQSFLIQNNVLQ